MSGKDIRTTYPKIQYNLYRRSFDVKTHNFGDEELVYDAAGRDKSATLPRISPDGRYLLFAQGQYGCFHIRHNDGDIVCMPLDQAMPLTQTIDLSKVNYEGRPDSYPSWSSNGHWMMVASRREDLPRLFLLLPRREGREGVSDAAGGSRTPYLPVKELQPSGVHD